MERIFSNLYRFSTTNKRGLSHTYLLLRKEGNILVCHQTRPPQEHIKEIEKLGGVSSQWVCHNHDVIKEGFHEDMHDRFGCEIHHHQDEKKAVRRKTKCPQVPYGDDGLQIDDNFEAFYFPACTVGHSLFRWKDRGKFYLFTSHSIYNHDNQWHIHARPRPEASPLEKLPVDYIFPGYTAPDHEAFYRLNDQSRKSFAKALKDKRTAN